jgi:hypothetical protein
MTIHGFCNWVVDFRFFEKLIVTQLIKTFPASWNLKVQWRISSSGIWRRIVRWVSTDVSGEHIASIFRVEEKVQKTSEQAGGKRRLKLNGLHGIISQKMILFITTAVKTSNPTEGLIFSKTSHQMLTWTSWVRLSPSSFILYYPYIYACFSQMVSSLKVFQLYTDWRALTSWI